MNILSINKNYYKLNPYIKFVIQLSDAHLRRMDVIMLKNKMFFNKLIIVALPMITSILFGCGQSEIDVTNTKLMGIEEKRENSEATESIHELLEVSINSKAEDIHFNSEDDIDLLRAAHRSVSDGKNIYLVYGEPDLYVMQVGADQHYPVHIDNPEKMDICNIALDTNGRIHLLMSDENNENWFIWQLDENLQVDKRLDVSTYFEEANMPLWFLIDKDGNYYLQWILKRNGIIVDSEGELKHKFTPKTLNTKWIYEAAVGRDGQFYLVYGERDVNKKVGKLNVTECSLEKGNSSLSFSGTEVFSAMSSGIDTNLLLFSPCSGVWVYDDENGIMENRVPLSVIGFGAETEFYPMLFLPDGRVLIIGQTVNDQNGVNDASVDTILKYLPVVK